MKCSLCGSLSVSALGIVGSEPYSVLSDLRTSPFSPKIYGCEVCGHLQKFHSPDENAALRFLYEAYEAHPLPKIGERLFYPEGGFVPRTRTYQALEQCLSLLPRSGKLLDVGAGSGAVLKSASELLPGWHLYGFDIGVSHKEAILKIPQVESFFMGDPGDITAGPFDLIVLWHSLEHAPDPSGLLSKLRGLLTQNGFLLIQVPDLERTPFDLAVMDHCSHFTKSRLLDFCLSQGFQCLLDGQEWTHNCITLLLKKNPKSIANDVPRRDAKTVAPEKYFHWLNGVARHFNEVASERHYAIFGTSIAGIWLLGQMTKKPFYFLDMDERAVGLEIEGISIRGLADAQPGDAILMAFTRETGGRISERAKERHPSLNSLDFILSPVF